MDKIIFLDLDGVLINPFPAWKPDEEDRDGYARFNPDCTAHLRTLLEAYPALKIVISSSRRVGKSLEELEAIFAFRGIKNKVIGKIPEPGEQYLSRAEEIVQYVGQQGLRHFLILDDDRSLLQLPTAYAPYLVLTEYRAGFDEACLEKAIGIVEGWENKT
ncbi:HAD domain-containing protein [Phaeodactylibacter xiamenensis]|uniref:HAD domain-containing protein n=1 Tax=Phaeodactylibacter xiamenensis TaxID=1524460 RepID=UPI003BAB3F2F